MAQLSVEIVTPERGVTHEDVEGVSLPTPEGEISMLPHHTSYLGVLAPGEIRLRKDGVESFLAVSGGVVEIRDGHQVKVLADTAERAEEISEARAEEARRRAEELRRRVMADDVAFARATAAIEKELARLRVVRKVRHRGHQSASRGVLSA